MEIFCVVFILLFITAIIGKVSDNREKKNGLFAFDVKTKRAEPKYYYWEELDEKIEEICAIGEEKIGNNGLKYYKFGTGVSNATIPEIKIRFKEYWKEPQTRKDFQKLGCTSIEYDGSDRDFRSWTCYKQIGKKILHLYFLKGRLNDCRILSIYEINQQEETAYNKVYEVVNTKGKSSVYLMRNPLNNTHKIGKANNVEKRLNTFKTSNPDIELVTSKEFPNERAAYNIESMLHKQFQEQNTDREWFNLTDEQVNIVKALLS